MQFTISVIIPIYNGALYLEKAIGSALQQPHVTEVIAINDGSKDATKEILKKIEILNPKLKVFNHYNNQNKGRSASRNLGIQKATSNYIAFLDADDFYLENRFENDKNIFEQNENVEGVYNAIGVHFYRNSTQSEKVALQLTTVSEKIKPELLFETLLSGKKGYFSIDGLTVKKSIFEKTGYFSQDLLVAEDTELILKMALKSVLVSGIIVKPVALRGVHENNSFSNNDLYKIYRIKMYNNLLKWCLHEKIHYKKIDLIINLLFNYRIKYDKTIDQDFYYWIKLFLKWPKLIFNVTFIKNFPIIRRRKFLFKKK